MQGIQALSEHGADGLTVESLAQRLGVPSDSFYTHFKSKQAYIDALLAFYETECTNTVIAVAETITDPRAKMRLLLDITTSGAYLSEIAFRAWAQQNSQVRAVQERIDSQRVAYMRGLCRPLTDSDEAAEAMARLLYLIYVGNQGLVPSFDGATIQRLYSAVLGLYLPDES